MKKNSAMLQLSEIWIYPVKSLGGIKLQKAQVTDRGLEHDRRWLLVDENGMFLTQREYPELALFQTEIREDFLFITHKLKLETIKILLYQSFSEADKKIAVTVWEDLVQAYEVNPLVSDWFSQLLEFPVRLVYMPEESHRKVDADYAVTGEDITSFSDGYPFLLIGQSSLDDLNSRMKEVLPMNRFRPNFVFSGGEAYEEDYWHKFTIGGLSFFGVKPSGRCVITTIDQELGVKSGKEPLFTLSTYRKVGDKVLFGQNVIGTQKGSLSIGDEVKVLSRTKLQS